MIIGKIGLFIILPFLAIFTALTSLPKTALFGLLAVAVVVFITPAILAPTRWGAVFAMVIVFFIILGTGYALWTVAEPFRVNNPLVSFLLSIWDFDLLPPAFFRFLVALTVSIILGMVAWVGNAMAHKGVIPMRV